MHHVIDVMNVIGSRPDGWWRDRPAAIERLLAEVDRWALENGQRVTAVLEQPPSSPIPAQQVEIVWAPRASPNSADQEIVRRLPSWLVVGAVTVVTSDRELAEKAGSLGAAVAPATAFRRQLESH